uniref:Exportin-T n=1 Tax=Ananas comosus var. bracteatus TaxID=296719 RepID=A0A6V7Q555_ANACO|nr:unnamed protein product [Ananas comosus var. bracteatus]
MDDLEKAILIAYDPDAGAAADPALRAQALAYCEGARSAADASAVLRLCFDRLARSPSPSPLLVPPNPTRRRRPPLPRHPRLRPPPPPLLPPRPRLRPPPPRLVPALPQEQARPGPRRPHPPRVPRSLALALPPPPPRLPSAGPHAVDMFARVLSALDDDLLSLDYPRSQDDAAAAARVKDAMRLQCVPQIARHWFDAAALYRASEPAAAAAALDAARRYITWIDITLIANDTFLPLLFDIALGPADSPDPLRAAAAGCIQAVVAKRMDPRMKLALLRSLGIGGRLFSADPEVVLKLSALVIGYAAEVLECYKKLGADGARALDLLEESFPSVFFVMESCHEDVDTCNVVEFLSDYVSTMKSPAEKQLGYLGQILQVIHAQISYDPAYRANLDIPDKIGKDEEDEMGEHRKDFLALFRSICRVAPDVAQLFIKNLLVASLSSPESNVEDVEASLTLFYRLGETVSDEAMRLGTGLLGELVPMLLSARFSCHSHRVVALVYLESITRYMKFVQENTQYVPHLLAAFLDERGVHHPNVNVSRRASYLFMRAVKLLKSKLVPFLDTILQQSLQDTVVQFGSSWTNKELKFSSSEDGSQTFEAIGLLIGMEDVSPEKQSDYLAALLNPLCQQIKSLLLDAKLRGLEESSPKAIALQRIIVALNALSKGFSERLVTSSRPAIGIMFKQASIYETLDAVLQVLGMFSAIKPLRSKITSFLHRMIEILGTSIFPCLPVALKQLLVENESKDMVDFLVLINQLICKFNTSAGGILEDIFPAIASRLFDILSRDAFPSGPGSNNEEIRELQELQRTLYTFLHVIATHDLSSVFLSPNSRDYLEHIMQLLLYTSYTHKDILLRKLCVQIFVRLIKDWCTNYNGEDKLPGFRSFVIDKFAPNCCFYSVLDESFDFRDANTLLLFGEIVVAQKVITSLPQELAEQYYQKLQGNDIKALRSFYQSLIEDLRQQQNGSVVFR